MKEITCQPQGEFDIKRAYQRYIDLSAFSKNIKTEYDAVEILHKMKKQC